MSNYQKYIMITKQNVYTDYSGTVYWNFSGSANIIYNDVVISYTNDSSGVKTCELTIFGAGQIVGSWYSGMHNGDATITNVTGSIEIKKVNFNETTIQLNLENYTKYLSISEQSNFGDIRGVTYWNFSGSSSITYNNVVISYTNYSSDVKTCELTIFGAGQIIGYWYSGLHKGSTTITNVSGSVTM